LFYISQKNGKNLTILYSLALFDKISFI